MTEYVELLQRIERLSARADGPCADGELLSEIEDVLAEGYMRALTEEAQSRRMAARLEELALTIDEPDASREARRLAVQRRSLDGRISTLRDRLTTVREQFIRLGGGQSVPR
jgi:hypothetical protein